MRTSEIIRTAWRIVNHTKGLLWFGVVPAIFTTIFGVGYIFYQFLAFESSPFFGNKHFDFSQISGIVLDFAGAHHFVVVLFVGTIVVGAIAYFILPPFCESAIIGLVAAIFGKKDVRASDGVTIGAQHFLKMFELQMLVSTFSLFEFLTIGSSTVRKLGTPAWLFILLGFLFFVSLILSFLFIYAQNFLVLKSRESTENSSDNDRGLIWALMSSAKLVIANFHKTLSMWFLMFLISIRVVINVILIFFIPALVVFLANFFVSTIALSIGISLAILVGIIVLGLAAYLAGVLRIFTTAAWTLTFLTIDHNRTEKLLEK